MQGEVFFERAVSADPTRVLLRNLRDRARSGGPHLPDVRDGYWVTARNTPVVEAHAR